MSYTTIRAPSRAECVEKRSRFIGQLIPVSCEQEALDFIALQRQQFWDANHNVYAYILREGQKQRYSDDGEPQGTAGVPVLEVLQREGLTDVCAVVTRYFGGILLGGGGLVRAYSKGAKIAVDAAQRRVMEECVTLELDADYNLYGKISYLLPQLEIQTLDSSFGAAVHLKLLMRQEVRGAFEKHLRELSSGTITPYLTDEGYAELRQK